MKAIFSLLFVILLFGQGNSQSLSAKDIIEKSEAKLRSGNSYAEMKMTIQRPKWTRTLEMKCWSNELDKTLIYITAPTRDEGISYLKLKEEIWNWQPKIERTIKLPPSMMSQAWMGSDFTNDDLVKHSSLLIDYKHAIIGEEVLADIDCYKLKLTPYENAAVVWGELIVWVTKKDFMQLKIEFFDEDSTLVSTLTASDIKKFGDRTLPSKLTIQPENKSQQFTVIEYENWIFNTDLAPGLFSIQNMKKEL